MTGRIFLFILLTGGIHLWMLRAGFLNFDQFSRLLVTALFFIWMLVIYLRYRANFDELTRAKIPGLFIVASYYALITYYALAGLDDIQLRPVFRTALLLYILNGVAVETFKLRRDTDELIARNTLRDFLAKFRDNRLESHAMESETQTS